MADQTSEVLPYRVDGPAVTKLVEARSRGRELSQIQGLNFSVKNFEGTLNAAYALDLLNPETDSLTEAGRRFALASESDRKEILLEKILQYQPYELLLEAVFDLNGQVTPLDWIERWWSTHGYGNSRSNRAEGATAFARFIEFLDLGAYLQGRKGHPTRIEWKPSAADRIAAARSAGTTSDDNPSRETEESTESSITQQLTGSPGKIPLPERRPPTPSSANHGVTGEQFAEETMHLSLPLGSGRTVKLSIPAKLRQEEKERILKALDYLIVVEGDHE